MGFDDVLEKVVRDSRTHYVPILYLIQVLMVCDDLKLFKEEDV